MSFTKNKKFENVLKFVLKIYYLMCVWQRKKAEKLILIKYK